MFGDDLVGEGGDVPRRDPVGDRVGVVVVDRVAGGETLRECRRPLGLDTDDPGVGATPPECGRHATDQPPASDGDHHRVERRHLVEQLQPECSLAGDDRRVVVRVDERRLRLVGELPSGGHRRPERLADQLHLGAVPTGRVDLRLWRRLRHHDRRVDTQLRRGEGDPLGVVAGAGGDDPVDRAVTLDEIRDRVVRPPWLERAGLLEVFELEPHVRADRLPERPALDDRCLLDLWDRRQPFAGGLHVC